MERVGTYEENTHREGQRGEAEERKARAAVPDGFVLVFRLLLRDDQELVQDARRHLHGVALL